MSLFVFCFVFLFDCCCLVNPVSRVCLFVLTISHTTCACFIYLFICCVLNCPPLLSYRRPVGQVTGLICFRAKSFPRIMTLIQRRSILVLPSKSCFSSSDLVADDLLCIGVQRRLSLGRLYLQQEEKAKDSAEPPPPLPPRNQGPPLPLRKAGSGSLHGGTGNPGVKP